MSYLSIRRLASNCRAASAQNVEVDGRALASVERVVVVKVVESTTQASVEDGGVPDGERAVAAHGPPSSVDGSSLRRPIELELAVGRDVTGAVLGVHQDTVLEGHDERGIGLPLYTMSETA